MRLQTLWCMYLFKLVFLDTIVKQAQFTLCVKGISGYNKESELYFMPVFKQKCVFVIHDIEDKLIL